MEIAHNPKELNELLKKAEAGEIIIFDEDNWELLWNNYVNNILGGKWK